MSSQQESHRLFCFHGQFQRVLSTDTFLILIPWTHEIRDGKFLSIVMGFTGRVSFVFSVGASTLSLNDQSRIISGLELTDFKGVTTNISVKETEKTAVTRITLVTFGTSETWIMASDEKLYGPKVQEAESKGSGLTVAWAAGLDRCALILVIEAGADCPHFANTGLPRRDGGGGGSVDCLVSVVSGTLEGQQLMQ
ncbi:hypothetical protein Tco_1102696 [Tanacetum coccineum]